MKTSNAGLKVSFYLKKNMSRKGLSPVMGRIAIGKDMVQFSCKIEANPALWDTRAGRMNGKSNHAREVNREIDRINVAVNARYREIMSIHGQATASAVKNACQGIAPSQETLLKVFREHNDEYEKRIGVNISQGTFENYGDGYRHLSRFIRQKYHLCDISFRQLDYSFIEDYDYFLRIDCGLKPGTVVNRMICLRKMVRIATGRGIISRDPFFGYSVERPKPCQRYVPEDEVEKLMKTPLKSHALNVTRDMSVFSCFTGLSHIDLFNLTEGQMIKSDDGTLWLNINRQKTGSASRIPLLDIPLQLIEKYRGTGCGGKVFPMKGGSHMNAQLKRIAELCGIERKLTFHMSRHTFATETCLSQGVPVETVSRMMGHRKLSTTQIYAKVTHGRVNEDMQALSEKLNGMYVLAP
jgi:site-specific recombinase XerD